MTKRTKTELLTLIDNLLPTNNIGAITPEDVKSLKKDILDSMLWASVSDNAFETYATPQLATTALGLGRFYLIPVTVGIATVLVLAVTQ